VRMDGQCQVFQIRAHFHRQYSLGQQLTGIHTDDASS
jgi:hypothetical protein